jgi:hypothetical protein
MEVARRGDSPGTFGGDARAHAIGCDLHSSLFPHSDHATLLSGDLITFKVVRHVLHVRSILVKTKPNPILRIFLQKNPKVWTFGFVFESSVLLF